MKSITKDLSAALFITIFFTCLSVGVIYYLIQAKYEEQSLRTRLSELTERITESLSYHLWNINDEEIIAASKIYLNSEVIEAIQVMDEDGRVIFDGGVFDPSNPYKLNKTVFYNEVSVGSIIAELNQNTLQQTKRNTLTIVIVLMVFAIGASVLMVQLTLRHFLSRPINTLNHSIDSLLAGKYEHQLSDSEKLEFLPITSAINQLTQKLKEREREIQDYTEKLVDTNKRLMVEIHERKAIQEQLVQSQKMEAIGTLAGGVAHDFNNILVAILGYSEMLMTRLDEDSDIKQDIEQIYKAGQRASALTQQLLAFSRKQIIQPRIIDLNHTINDMLIMLQRLLGETIQIQVESTPELKRIKADPGQIDQVIVNIAVNARDAMPKGGTFLIELKNVTVQEEIHSHGNKLECGSYVLMSFSDTGIGMDKETQERIFEPFFTTKDKAKGTGLGLSTIYGIVKQNNAHINVYSELGKGTTFKVYFPTIHDVESNMISKNNRNDDYRGTESVLVVEDDEIVNRFIFNTLVEQGYKVSSASSYDEALKQYDNHGSQFDLLITDVVLPGKSGKDVASHLSKLQPSLAVMFMSGYTDNAIVHHNVIDEGILFIQKPFSSNDLLEQVRHVLDAR